jgi:TonB family protein
MAVRRILDRLQLEGTNMPAFLLPLISGAVVAATPATPQPWFEFKDYPMKAFEKSAEGVTRFELLIAPDGRIADCKVTSSSGNEELDKTSCFLASKRAKFRPARDADGRAVWGTYRTQALWALPEHKLISPPAPDLEVSLNQLPDGTKQPPAVKLAYAVDQQGNPSPGSCTLMPSSLPQPQVLVQLGCKELLERAPRAPVIDPAGQAVPAVKTGAVLFKTGS